MVEANVFLVMEKVSEQIICLVLAQILNTIVACVEVMVNVHPAMEQGNKVKKTLLSGKTFFYEIKLGLILLTRYQPFWVDGLNSMRQQYNLEKQRISFCWMISKKYSPNTNLFLECLPG